MKRYGEMTAAERTEFEMDWVMFMMNMISMPGGRSLNKRDKMSMIVLILKTMERPLANCLVEFEADRGAFARDAIAMGVRFIENQIEMTRMGQMPVEDTAGPVMLEIMSDPTFEKFVEGRAEICLRAKE